MRAFVRSGLSAALVLGGLMVGGAQAQQTPPAAKGAASTGDLKQVLATVNDEPITKSDLLDLVVRYNVPLGDAAQKQQVYKDGVETLINTKLINQFLSRQRLPVSNEKIDAEIEDLKAKLKEDGQDLATALLQSGKTIDDVRKEMANRQRWVDYVKLKGTDAELKRYVGAHEDIFNGKQVRASHIMLPLSSGDEKEKEKVRQQLVQLKSDIQAGKYTFAEAANKFSVDERKAQGDGGDIGYFGRNDGILEEFAGAAFALKKGQLSDPVETPMGYHLIQVTDRKEGAPLDFEAKKQFVLQMYSMELQKNILAAEKDKAKIDVKPMPADVFPPTPASDAGATKGAAPKAAPKP